MNQIDYIAKYIAEDLAELKIYDLISVKSKIKLALTLLQDETITKSEIDLMGGKAKRHLYVIDKHKHDLKFWKEKLRQNVSDEEMQEFYKQIDEQRIQNGFT